MTHNEQRSRAGHLKRRYGISLDQYQQLLDKQNGCCGVCKRHHSEFPIRLAVEHNHSTGEIRGLACTWCNRYVIGRHTDSTLIRSLADYLDQKTGWFVPPQKPKKRKRKT